MIEGNEGKILAAVVGLILAGALAASYRRHQREVARLISNAKRRRAHAESKHYGKWPRSWKRRRRSQ